jgi:hypothetical protein
MGIGVKARRLSWILAALVACPSAFVLAASSREKYVHSRNVSLCSTPSLRDQVWPLTVGLKVAEVGAPRNNWSRIRVLSAGFTGPAEGWVDASALTVTPVYASIEDVPLEARENPKGLAMVTNRGFGNKDVKAELLKVNREVSAADFAAVDSMEAHTIELTQLEMFLREGGLVTTLGDSL